MILGYCCPVSLDLDDAQSELFYIVFSLQYTLRKILVKSLDQLLSGKLIKEAKISIPVFDKFY